MSRTYLLNYYFSIVISSVNERRRKKDIQYSVSHLFFSDVILWSIILLIQSNSSNISVLFYQWHVILLLVFLFWSHYIIRLMKSTIQGLNVVRWTMDLGLIRLFVLVFFSVFCFGFAVLMSFYRKLKTMYA